MGRPSRYSKELAEKIVGVLTTGVSYTNAALYCGVDPKTFYSWMERKPEFAEKCKRAKAGVVIFMHRQELEAARNGEAWAIKGYLDREERRRQNRENLKIRREELAIRANENVTPSDGLPPTPQEYAKQLDEQFAFEVDR